MLSACVLVTVADIRHGPTVEHHPLAQVLAVHEALGDDAFVAVTIQLFT